MNEFVEQFLIECRELVTQATDDLLALEESGDDRERLDSAFRAFHTLKGAAGIVDFDAMGRALHAAEDVLAAVRSNAGQVTPQLIGDCLTALDQVSQWLDAMQETGEVPAGADAQADAVVQRFGRTIEPPVVAPAVGDQGDWLASLLTRHPEASTRAHAALRYAPDAEAFFRNEDPLAVLEALPNLLALELESPASETLETFDPFVCRMVFAALFGAEAEGVRVLLAERGGIELVDLSAAGGNGLPPVARSLIEAQVLLLADPDGEPGAGRTTSALRVAANVLRSIGRGADADRMATIGRDGAAEALAAVLTDDFGASAQRDGPAPTRIAQEAVTRALRVDVERIDALVNLTGELTVAKNALAHAAALAQSGDDPRALGALLKEQHSQLERLVAELQRSVLNIRVLPMRQVFQRFPRLVREMVVGLGKPARLVTEGDDTEADKAVVEALFEPLLHVLRNALDHGVESPQVRAAAGKPPSATIHLRAARQGDRVVIEVEDDGGGIDIASVRAVATERGVASADVLAAMPDDEVADLIFAPGFSTAAEVTSLSGRGVGMDAVRIAVERMGGRVTLQSRTGEGTTVRFALPFTVMMTAVMTVEAGGQMFGIPLESIEQTLRLSRDRISPVGAARAFVLRERTVPLIDLAQTLGRPPTSERRLADGDDGANVVVTLAAGQWAGLEVDRVAERMDVMLKPLDGLLAGMHGIAGTTMLGDGRVLLVLDLQALLQ
jgi:two-component system chemotaxis sensor kinase CheA